MGFNLLVYVAVMLNKGVIKWRGVEVAKGMAR